ncbi:MAG TPA: GFA family protein [Caulobacteraceae bacterium]|jgi:hypothetical protein
MPGTDTIHIDGACFCGRVTFEADVDPHAVGICHCTDCQKLTGTAYRVSVSAPREAFRLTGAAPKLFTKIAESGRPRYQYFCPDCGSPIYTTGEGPDAERIGIRWGTISQRAALRPGRRIWNRSAPQWVEQLAEMPAVPKE